MATVQQIGAAKKQEVSAKCSITYVGLSIAWYADNNEGDKAKELVQLLLNSSLSDQGILITDRHRTLLEEASPFSVLA